jgi:hypothetical protein
VVKRKTSKAKENENFLIENSMVTSSGHIIESGSLIKVTGQHGSTFQFKCLMTNKLNNKSWVDCYELHRGVPGPIRSFYPDQIKPVVKRGKRVKRNSDS